MLQKRLLKCFLLWSYVSFHKHFGRSVIFKMEYSRNKRQKQKSLTAWKEWAFAYHPHRKETDFAVKRIEFQRIAHDLQFWKKRKDDLYKERKKKNFFGIIQDRERLSEALVNWKQANKIKRKVKSSQERFQSLQSMHFISIALKTWRKGFEMRKITKKLLLKSDKHRTRTRQNQAFHAWLRFVLHSSKLKRCATHFKDIQFFFLKKKLIHLLQRRYRLKESRSSLDERIQCSFLAKWKTSLKNRKRFRIVQESIRKQIERKRLMNAFVPWKDRYTQKKFDRGRTEMCFQLMQCRRLSSVFSFWVTHLSERQMKIREILKCSIQFKQSLLTKILSFWNLTVKQKCKERNQVLEFINKLEIQAKIR